MHTDNVVRITSMRARTLASMRSDPRRQRCLHEIYRLADVMVSPNSPMHLETARAHLLAILDELNGTEGAR